MKIKQMAERLNSVTVRKKAKQILAVTLAVLMVNPVTGYGVTAHAQEGETIAELTTEIESTIVATVTSSNGAETYNCNKLEDAITKAQGMSDSTLKLLANVSAGDLTVSSNPMALDLNSFTLTCGKIDVQNAFTLTDTASGGKVLGNNDNGAIWLNGGQITINGGRIEATGEYASALRIFSGTAIIEGGSFHSQNAYGVMHAGGSVSISGGEFSTGSPAVRTGFRTNGGTAQISGGRFINGMDMSEGTLNDIISSGHALKKQDNSYILDLSQSTIKDDVSIVEASIAITGQPTGAELLEGYEAGAHTLTVPATAKPGVTISYKWYRNDTEISDANEATYALPEGLSAGTYVYHCKLSESGGYYVLSNKVTVKVYSSAVEITQQPTADQNTVVTGYTNPPTLTIEARLPAGLTGEFSYQWYQNSTSGAEDAKVGENQSSYQLPLGLPQGSYTYYCKLSYGASVVTSDPVTIAVADAVASMQKAGETDITYFTDLQDAFSSAPNNGSATIRLLKDCTRDSNLVLYENRAIIFDLGGHTLTFSNDKGDGIKNNGYESCQLTLENGNLVGNGYSVVQWAGKSLTVRNATIKNQRVDFPALYFIGGYSGRSLWLEEGAVLEAQNGNVTTGTPGVLYIQDGDDIHINGGTIHNTGSGVVVYASVSQNIHLGKAGVIQGGNGQVRGNIYFDEDDAAVTVYGGMEYHLLNEVVEGQMATVAYADSSKTAMYNKSYGKSGATVSVTISPNEGNAIGGLPVISYGASQTVSDVTKTSTEGYGIADQALTFTFTMPKGTPVFRVQVKQPNAISTVEGKNSKVYDGNGFNVSTTKGEFATWNGNGVASVEGYYTKNQAGDYIQTTVNGSGAAMIGGAPINAGTYYAKVNLSADDVYRATIGYVPFTITQSGTTFDGGIKTYKGETATSTFTYGDTITVKITPKATGKLPGTEGATGISSAPTDNNMALYVGENKIEESAAVDGVYIMSYDTKGKALASSENVITVKYVGNSNVADYSENVTVTLNKKVITSAGVNTSDVSASKAYDGINSFEGVALTTLTGVENGDTVLATANGIVTDVNVGTGKAFTATSVTLEGDHKDYYSLDNSAVSGNVSITQAATAGVNQELQVVKGLAKEYTFDLTKLLPALSDGKSFGDITYTVETVSNVDSVLTQNPTNSDIADGKITLKVANVTYKDKTATVQIKVKSTNYKDFTADLTVKTIDKTPLNVEAVFTGGTYNGKPYAYTGTPTFKNGTDAVTGITYTATYTGRDDTTYGESETAPTNAGKYNLILTVSGESANTYAGTTTIGFEITKKQITAKPNDASIKSNASFPAYTWSINTGIAGETITAANAKDVVMEAQENGKKLDTVKVGTFDIVFTTAPAFNQKDDIEKNYDIQVGKGKLTVAQYNPGGGTPSGGGASSDSGTTVITPPAATEILNPPTKVTAAVPSNVTNGTANVTLSQSAVADAISKAQAEAKKKGTEENGIAVEIKVDTKNSTPNSLSANLPKVSMDALVKTGVKDVCINSGAATINFNLETLKTIQKEIDGDVTISAKKVDNSTLSAEAKAIVGNRPVFDFNITGTKGTKVTNFGNGMVSVSIPYTLGANEKAGNVVAYYIDNEGKVQEIPNSVYDEKTKTLMFTTNHFSQYAAGYKADKATTFTDIANHWAKEVIEFVTARGLLSETEKGKFSPNGAMTRGMFVTALGRLAEVAVSSCKTTKFTDVKADSCYLPYIEWASKKGILKGITETTFAPDQSITREQMAVIMADYAKVMGFELVQVYTENTFADNAKMGSDAKVAVKQMQIAGVLTGKNSSMFNPQGTATRAEVSALLNRFAELVINRNTAEGWMQNDSGSLLYYKDGKALTGKQTIDGVSYEFNQYGETILKPSSTAETNTPKVDTNTTQKDKTNTVKKPAYKTYTVKKGDCFWSIARKFKVNIYTLLKLNNKSISSIIRPGNVLKIPQK